MTISLSETPSRSCGSRRASAGGGPPSTGRTDPEGPGPGNGIEPGPVAAACAGRAGDGAADAERPPAVGAGPERADRDGPAVTVVPVVGTGRAAPVVAVVAEAAGIGAAAAPVSGPPTPAFWPQAADTRT